MAASRSEKKCLCLTLVRYTWRARQGTYTNYTYRSSCYCTKKWSNIQAWSIRSPPMFKSLDSTDTTVIRYVFMCGGYDWNKRCTLLSHDKWKNNNNRVFSNCARMGGVNKKNTETKKTRGVPAGMAHGWPFRLQISYTFVWPHFLHIHSWTHRCNISGFLGFLKDSGFHFTQPTSLWWASRLFPAAACKNAVPTRAYHTTAPFIRGYYGWSTQ